MIGLQVVVCVDSPTIATSLWESQESASSVYKAGLTWSLVSVELLK